MYRRALILLMGSGLAQLGPLAFAPVLSRLYGAEVFGTFQLATAVAANLAVVACARYEFALPLATDAFHAQRLRQLSGRILLLVSLLTLLAAGVWAWIAEVAWPLAIPFTVAALGSLSLWTLEVTRRHGARALATARVVQYWGCGGIQAVLGWASWGVWGLLLGPILAAAVAAVGLRWHLAPQLQAEAGEGAGGEPRPAPRSLLTVAATPTLRDIAHRFRDFPLLNTPHAFLGALQDTVSLALVAGYWGPAAAGIWGLTLRLLKAPATLAGGAVSQALYPHLTALGGVSQASRQEVRRLMCWLLVGGALWAGTIAMLGPTVLPWALGAGWESSGPLAPMLALYIGVHFVASPLAVVTMAWEAQAWALRMSLVGQAVFVAAVALGLTWGPEAGLAQAGLAVSGAMAVFYGAYFWRLAWWPVCTPRTMGE